MFVVAKPEVFKSPVSETYIIFGEAKMDDLSSQAAANAAAQFRPDVRVVSPSAPTDCCRFAPCRGRVRPCDV